MIKLDRLTVVATTALVNAQNSLAGMTDTVAATFSDASTANAAWLSMRDGLRLAQHYKCGWCETFLQERAEEVDHIRPKGKTQYWWLVVTVENLLLACRSCNNLKSDKWPLRSGAALVPRQLRSSAHERALAFDPTFEDPSADLTFVFAGGEWRVTGLSHLGRGAGTIDLVSLDRDGLRRAQQDYVTNTLDPVIRQMQAAVKAQDRQGFQDALIRLRNFTLPTKQWSALSTAVLREAQRFRYEP